MEIQYHRNTLLFFLLFYHYHPPPHPLPLHSEPGTPLKSDNVNIILFQKERYLNLFVSTAAYIYMSQFEFRGIKRCR